MQTVSLFPGVVYVISDLSKKFSINFSTSSSFRPFFFLNCYLQLYVDLIFLQEFQPSQPSFVDWMGVIFQSYEHFSSKFVLLKMLTTWLVLFLKLTFQCWPAIALTLFFRRYSLKRAVSFFLNTLYSFGSRYFLLSLSRFFSCGIVGLIQITLFLVIIATVIFVYFLFTIFNNFFFILYLLTCQVITN